MPAGCKAFGSMMQVGVPVTKACLEEPFLAMFQGQGWHSLQE
jgi:hypothetical protein